MLGIWPEGDFRIVRGDVSGSLLAAAIGFLAAAYGAWVLFRRRQLALLAMLVAGAVVYVGARLVAEIHVEAKALAVIAPLVLLVALRALFAPDGRDRPASLRGPPAALVALAALGSTLLALRAAPVGFDDRGEALERLAEQDRGRAAGLPRPRPLRRLLAARDADRAPAGYVPRGDRQPRPEKAWHQGLAVDWDNLDSRKLDKFRYAITTSAAYQSRAAGELRARWPATATTSSGGAQGRRRGAG